MKKRYFVSSDEWTSIRTHAKSPEDAIKMMNTLHLNHCGRPLVNPRAVEIPEENAQAAIIAAQAETICKMTDGLKNALRFVKSHHNNNCDGGSICGGCKTENQIRTLLAEVSHE